METSLNSLVITTDDVSEYPHGTLNEAQSLHCTESVSTCDFPQIIHSSPAKSTCTITKASKSQKSPPDSNSPCTLNLSRTESPITTNDAQTSPSCSDDSGFSEQEEKGSPSKKKRYGNCPPDGNLLPPCRVCGEKASGLHYGANTCEPCKGFFRRCIVKLKKKEEYQCPKEGKCSLQTGRRLICSACRYKKCLEVGMSHDAIKIGRYTYQKRTSDIIELKKSKMVEENSSENSETYVDETEATDLVEKLIQIQDEFSGDFRESFKPDSRIADMQRSIYEEYKMKLEVFGNLGVIPSSVYKEFYEATGIEIDDRQNKMNLIANFMERYIRIMIKFARNLPGFSDLSTEDQMALLKAGYHEYWFLDFHTRVNAELRVIAHGDLGLGSNIGAHQSEICSILDQSNIDVMFECAANLKKCKLTAEEATLARGIVLTFTDQCTLQEPEKVEKIQWYLVNCLRCISKKNYKNPDQRIWQIFDKFLVLRGLADHGREIDNIKAQWPVMKNHPLVLEIIQPDVKQGKN